VFSNFNHLIVMQEREPTAERLERFRLACGFFLYPFQLFGSSGSQGTVLFRSPCAQVIRLPHLREGARASYLRVSNRLLRARTTRVIFLQSSMPEIEPE